MDQEKQTVYERPWPSMTIAITIAITTTITTTISHLPLSLGISWSITFPTSPCLLDRLSSHPIHPSIALSLSLSPSSPLSLPLSFQFHTSLLRPPPPSSSLSLPPITICTTTSKLHIKLISCCLPIFLFRPRLRLRPLAPLLPPPPSTFLVLTGPFVHRHDPPLYIRPCSFHLLKAGGFHQSLRNFKLGEMAIIFIAVWRIDLINELGDWSTSLDGIPWLISHILIPFVCNSAFHLARHSN